MEYEIPHLSLKQMGYFDFLFGYLLNSALNLKNCWNFPRNTTQTRVNYFVRWRGKWYQGYARKGLSRYLDENRESQF